MFLINGINLLIDGIRRPINEWANWHGFLGRRRPTPPPPQAATHPALKFRCKQTLDVLTHFLAWSCPYVSEFVRATKIAVGKLSTVWAGT